MSAFNRFSLKTAAAALAIVLGTGSLGFAQAAAPVAPKAPAPAAAPVAPVAPKAPATTPPVTAPKAQLVNLNTATAEQLDALPQIGAARAKAIVDARAKGKFKNWDDFTGRKVVPTNAEAAIKDKVTF